MRNRKAESQTGEDSVQGLTAGLPLHDLSQAGILPHSLATDRGSDGEAQTVGGKIASGVVMRSAEPFLGGRNCPSFPGPERRENPLPHPLVWAPLLPLLPSASLPTSSVS